MKKLMLAALTTTSTPALAGEIDTALELLAGQASVSLPSVSARDRQQLARGEVVSLVEADRIAGLAVIGAPLAEAWAIVHDPAVTGDPAVQEVRLSARPDGTELWYGRMSLPSPLSDRQWVVRSVVHPEVHRASGGRVWERAWSEVDDGLELARPSLRAGHLAGVTESDLADAVLTPVNRGGWLMVALDEGRTLATYHARTDLGGSVPAWLVRSVARGQLSGLLQRVRRGVGQPHPAAVPGSGAS